MRVRGNHLGVAALAVVLFAAADRRVVLAILRRQREGVALAGRRTLRRVTDAGRRTEARDLGCMKQNECGSVISAAKEFSAY